MKAAAPYVDYCTAMACSFGVMAALMQRETTGRGQRVQASLLGTAMSLFGTYLTEQGALGINRPPTGNQVQTSAPSDVFETADGHILVHVIGPGLFRRVATLLGRADWLERNDLESDMQRGEAREEICGVMAAWCAERTNAQVLKELADAGVPAGPVLDAQEALDHEQVAASGLLQWLQPHGDEHPVPVPGFPFSLSDIDVPDRTYPAPPGKHSREILTELGFDEAFIDSMH